VQAEESQEHHSQQHGTVDASGSIWNVDLAFDSTIQCKVPWKARGMHTLAIAIEGIHQSTVKPPLFFSSSSGESA